MIDVAASLSHWWEHLEPVADELQRRSQLGAAFFPGDPMTKDRGRLTVVSSAVDMKLAHALGRRPVLMQHGVGQSYGGNRNASYPGGRGHEKCRLVLMPNEIAAARHTKFYAHRVPMEIVGSPHLDRLAEIPKRPSVAGPVVAVTWHWPCKAMGHEGGTAWTTIGPEVLERLVQERDLGNITLLGHAHPKGRDMVRDAYAALEVPFVESFDDVVAMADCLVWDNTSAGFEFSALDRPTVVIDSPNWRKGVKFAPRFYDYADLGPRTSNPDEVPALLTEALLDRPPWPQRRQVMMDDLFPFRGVAAERAVDAILSIADR